MESGGGSHLDCFLVKIAERQAELYKRLSLESPEKKQ